MIISDSRPNINNMLQQVGQILQLNQSATIKFKKKLEISLCEC